VDHIILFTDSVRVFASVPTMHTLHHIIVREWPPTSDKSSTQHRRFPRRHSNVGYCGEKWIRVPKATHKYSLLIRELCFKRIFRLLRTRELFFFLHHKTKVQENFMPQLTW